MKKLLLALAVLALALPLALPLSAAEPLSLADQEFLEALSDPNVNIGTPEVLPAQPPPCPTSVACTSPLGLCAISITCTTTNIGPCCSAGGLNRCCINGNILVKSCPCHGPGCPAAQVSSKCG
jgi:hypothetical protein